MKKYGELKIITEEEFFEKIKKKDGNFIDLLFEFPVSFQKIKVVDFPLRFSRSVFMKSVDFSRTIFQKEFLVNETVFEEDANFYYTDFSKRFMARRVTFKMRANFDLAHFRSHIDFSKAAFLNNVYFKKARFSQNLFFNKTVFCAKADFSYAHFSDVYFTSFININKHYHPDVINMGPAKFVFRNIFFPRKTMFNGLDLSRTTFKNSNIENIVFKNCHFLRKHKRAIFYPEIAKTQDVLVKKDFLLIEENLVNTILVPEEKHFKNLDLHDNLRLINEQDPKQEATFFITTRWEAANYKEMEELLAKIDQRNMLTDYNRLSCKKCLTEVDEDKPIIAFRIKRYSELRSWVILEDTYRQMKKSLEDSRDWQGASLFYRSEMNAKMKVLKLKGEQWSYRQLLKSYKRISGFGECIPRILSTMVISIALGVIFLKWVAPDLRLDQVLEKSISYFLPIFGNNTTSIAGLGLRPWQNLVLYIEIFWFYILWLNLAIALQRKLKR